MSISLDSALDSYDGKVYSDTGKITGIDPRLRVKRRGNYRHSRENGNGEERVELDIRGPFWYSQILVIRTDWLVQNKPQIAQAWAKDRTLSGLAKLAKKYLNSDYKISPRVARMVVYSALQKLIGDKELEGIDPDDNFYYKPKTSKKTKRKKD